MGIYFEITNINRCSLVMPHFKQLSSQMKCRKKNKSTTNTLKCVFQADFQNRSTFIQLCKKQGKETRNSRMFSNWLRHFDTLLFSSARRVNEWFALWGKNPFKGENILNSYLYRRKNKEQFFTVGGDGCTCMGRAQ